VLVVGQQNRCKLEKEQIAAREEFNRKLKEDRVKERRERTRKLAQTRFGVTGALIGGMDTGRSGLSTGAWVGVGADAAWFRGEFGFIPSPREHC